MKKQYFGTDGVRGVANQKLTPELAFSLGQAAGLWLKESGHTPRAVLGRDTRRSGPMLGAALAAGFCSVGVDVVALGVAPTGGVSFIARTGEFGLGAVISASHNPAPDNGIKLIGHNGRKLPDEAELDIEARMARPLDQRPTGGDVGTLQSDRRDIERYMEFLVGIVPEGLSGMHVAVDGSHGAAYELGPEVLRRLGTQVSTIGIEPDGMNINTSCGATHPSTIRAFTRETGAAVGVAFDGDADRAVFSDSEGRLINGDRTMAIVCTHGNGRVASKTVVGTVMSNTGFQRYLEHHGLRLERAPVGDKYVAQKMAETGATIGGEQSGHLIFADRGPTGDGLVTMLELLRVIRASGRTSAELFGDYLNWPQTLVNLKLPSREGWEQVPGVAEAIADANDMVVGKGRVVVRASGTQPIVRIMVEADQEDLRDRALNHVVNAMTQKLGAEIEGKVDLTYDLGD